MQRLEMQAAKQARPKPLGERMNCPKCEEKLEVARSCRRIRMRCPRCKIEYQIHEVADRLDQETEELLCRYPTIIYD